MITLILMTIWWLVWDNIMPRDYDLRQYDYHSLLWIHFLDHFAPIFTSRLLKSRKSMSIVPPATSPPRWSLRAFSLGTIQQVLRGVVIFSVDKPDTFRFSSANPPAFSCFPPTACDNRHGAWHPSTFHSHSSTPDSNASSDDTLPLWDTSQWQTPQRGQCWRKAQTPIGAHRPNITDSGRALTWGRLRTGIIGLWGTSLFRVCISHLLKRVYSI